MFSLLLNYIRELTLKADRHSILNASIRSGTNKRGLTNPKLFQLRITKIQHSHFHNSNFEVRTVKICLTQNVIRITKVNLSIGF